MISTARMSSSLRTTKVLPLPFITLIYSGDMYKAKDGTEFRFNDKYLEALIDLLEKNSFKEVPLPSSKHALTLFQHEYEQFFLPQDLDASHTNLDALDRASLADPDDVPCCVCNDREYQDDDQIILCDGCDLAIHQGPLPSIPPPNISHLH